MIKTNRLKLNQEKDYRDFSQGSVLGTLVRMAVPMTFALLINILYSIVDRMYIGHIPGTGHLALTGIGLISSIVTVVVAFQNLFGVGGSPPSSIARGRGSDKEAARVPSNACFMPISTGITLSVFLLLFKGRILYLIGASDQTFSYADDYLSIYLIRQATAFSMVGNIYASYYRQPNAVTALSLSEEDKDALLGGVTKEDVFAAFVY